ncbi:MAG: phosphotransferase [Gammaproteobacteria bacterium]|nr:phosphotransferase [Gammaproteobacteria bacterium]
MPQRIRQLEQWLGQACGLFGFTLEPASADASFRRYFRVTLDGGDTRIAMDAPPDKEDCRPFIDVAGRLAAAGLHVPHIHHADPAQGFMLLEDLGAESYLSALDDASVDALYADAIEALVVMQAGADAAGLPAYDEAMLQREMALFPDWLLTRHLGLQLDAGERSMLDAARAILVDNALAQPVVCVHRDYHSRNLMRLEVRNPGVIDFQDAVAGPVTYDLVSLLRDCYIAWPQARIDRWVDAYHVQARAAGLLDGVDVAQLATWFDLMGVQRHMKAAGIFARLNHRDGKPGYLADIPRTLQYIVDVGARHAPIAALAGFVEHHVLPRL